jgi:hypothetical protein
MTTKTRTDQNLSVYLQIMEWPHSEYDPNSSADANAQHMMHLLEGYRAFMTGEEDPPFSPGSARDFSWKAGFAKAKEDERRPPVWKTTDPRSELIDRKYAAIVILRPHPKGRGKLEAGTGHAEMKHGWHVSTSFESRPMVSDDPWDPAWLWTLTPLA